MTLRQETARQLKAFLDGEQDSETLEAWILAIEEEDETSDEEMESLIELRLILLEAGEGSRELEDAKALAADLLADAGVLGQSYSSRIATYSTSQNLTQGSPGFLVRSEASAST